jgi:hypothetical protein
MGFGSLSFVVQGKLIGLAPEMSEMKYEFAHQGLFEVQAGISACVPWVFVTVHLSAFHLCFPSYVLPFANTFRHPTRFQRFALRLRPPHRDHVRFNLIGDWRQTSFIQDFRFGLLATSDCKSNRLYSSRFSHSFHPEQLHQGRTDAGVCDNLG